MKHYKLEERYIPAHDLALKMLKKYPDLHASYDGALFFNDGKYPEEDFVHGLWIYSKDVPWARGWQERIDVFNPPSFCGSAVPRGRIYVYRDEVKWKGLSHDYCASENMDLNEQYIDEFMALVYEARKIQKELESKKKLKEIKKDFE